MCCRETTLVSNVSELYYGLHRLHWFTKYDMTSNTVPATLQLVDVSSEQWLIGKVDCEYI